MAVLYAIRVSRGFDHGLAKPLKLKWLSNCCIKFLWGIHLTQVTTRYCGWPLALAAPGKAYR